MDFSFWLGGGGAKSKLTMQHANYVKCAPLPCAGFLLYKVEMNMKARISDSHFGVDVGVGVRC
jgi:hypothetical protein